MKPIKEYIEDFEADKITIENTKEVRDFLESIGKKKSSKMTDTFPSLCEYGKEGYQGYGTIDEKCISAEEFLGNAFNYFKIEEFSGFITFKDYRVQVHNDAIYPLFDVIDVDDFEDVIKLLKEAKKLQKKYKKVIDSITN